MKLAVATYNELFANMSAVLIQGLNQEGFYSAAVITEFIQKYYDEYDPSSYRRTFQFLDSVVNSKVFTEGGKYIVDIYIDWQNIHYKYSDTKQIIEWANEGLHGGYDVTDEKSHFWDDAMTSLKDSEKSDIVRSFINFLRKATGCKVRSEVR